MKKENRLDSPQRREFFENTGKLANGIISKELVVDKNNLAKIKMPNVDGFICDNRVDTKSVLCMKNCPLPGEKDYNKWIKIDNRDYLKSDCLVQPNIKFEGE